MDQPIDIEQIKLKLYEKLKASGWADVLKGFLLSQEFTLLLQQLYDEMMKGDRFTPTLKQVFRAFECCPYDKLKLILLSQDPYSNIAPNGLTTADGISFSCSNDKKIQPSLKFIHQEIRKDIYKDDKKWIAPTDLKCWAEQGCLMLNIALTTTINKTGTHYMLWRPFIAYLLDVLGWNNPGLVWVFIGAKAKEYYKSIPDNCYKLTVTHPAFAAHMKLDSWNSDGIFVKTQAALIKAGKTPMIW